jgi:hypothetical protein
MDQSAAPLLEALTDYHARDRYGFTLPGHRQGRGADPRTVGAIGRDAFRSDVLATAGLDDRKSITAELLDYLRSGLAAGMQLPDPADPSLGIIGLSATPPPGPDPQRSGGGGSWPWPPRRTPFCWSSTGASACCSRT